jgi:hypothetical protein
MLADPLPCNRERGQALSLAIQVGHGGQRRLETVVEGPPPHWA